MPHRRPLHVHVRRWLTIALHLGDPVAAIQAERHRRAREEQRRAAWRRERAEREPRGFPIEPL